jgi:uncharacterized protein (DUF952 family)
MTNNSPDKKFLYHITHPAVLQTARETGFFLEESLTTEGFIHCSFQEQMIPTANRFYAFQTGLLILKIDPDRLHPGVRLEPAENGELFPHIYGAINLDAITAILAFDPGPDGHFSDLPAGVV